MSYGIKTALYPLDYKLSEVKTTPALLTWYPLLPPAMSTQKALSIWLNEKN